MRIKENCTILFLLFLLVDEVVYSQAEWKQTKGNMNQFAFKKEGVFQRIPDYPYLEYRLDTSDENVSFDCNDYKYFEFEKDQIGYPSLTRSDSLQLQRYSDKYHRIANKYKEGSYSASICHFIPFIRGEYDSVLAETLRSNPVFRHKSLTNHDILGVLTSDAVVIGKVVAKRYNRDTLKCLLFKTELIIEVEEVIHSYFNLQKGDKLLIKTHTEGYTAGCILRSGAKSRANSFMTSSDIYGIGDERIFTFDRYVYECAMMSTVSAYKYHDGYCPQAFTCSEPGFFYEWCMENEGLDTEFRISLKQKIADIRDFFNNEMLKK